MKRRHPYSIISTAVGLSTMVGASVYADASKADTAGDGSTALETPSSSPPDVTPYARPLSLEEFSPRGESPMGATTEEPIQRRPNASASSWWTSL
jgi:hypothetical protein